MKAKVTHKTLLEICEQRIEHILRKNADYGDAWQNNEGFTPLLRMREKLLRVETLSDGRKAMVEDETVDQDVEEIFDYALLYMLWKAWQPQQLSFEELGNLLKGINNDENIESIRKDYAESLVLVFGIPSHLLDGLDMLDDEDKS